jgi:mannosyltransferase
VFCVPALALLTGAGLSVLGRLPCIAAIAVIGLFALPMQHAYRAPGGHGDDIRATAQFLQAQARPGDAVIYYKFAMRDWGTAYPYGFAALRDVGLRQSAAAAGNLSGTQVAPRVLRTRLRSAARVWLVEVDHNRPDRGVIGPPRFRLTGVWFISDIVLRLYERTDGHAAPPPRHRVIPIRLEAWPPSITGR